MDTVSPVRKILFITSTRLGDAVLSTGLLDHLLRKYPKAEFTIACGSVAAGLFVAMPRRARTMVIHKYRYNLHWLALWWKCCFTRWDVVIDLRSSAISFFLFTQKRMIIRGGRIKERRVDYLARCFQLVPTPLPVVWTGENERLWARCQLPFQCYIALAPTANWQGKIWPAERFIELVRKLLAYNPSLRFVVFYGPGKQERKMVETVLTASLPLIDMGGDHTLTEVAALLSRCRGFVGNDSGLMHLAAACNIPVLGLFGPSKVAEYAPTGKYARAVVAPGKEGAASMSDLSVQEVFNAFKELLETSEHAT